MHQVQCQHAVRFSVKIIRCVIAVLVVVFAVVVVRLNQTIF